MTSTSNTTSSTSPASSAGASVGQKVKGAFQTMHGIGESIRGNALDFIDSATGTGREHDGLSRTEHDATIRGREETSVGVANMESSHRTQANAPVEQRNVSDGLGTGTTDRKEPEVSGGSAVGLGTGSAGAM